MDLIWHFLKLPGLPFSQCFAVFPNLLLFLTPAPLFWTGTHPCATPPKTPAPVRITSPSWWSTVPIPCSYELCFSIALGSPMHFQAKYSLGPCPRQFLAHSPATVAEQPLFSFFPSHYRVGEAPGSGSMRVTEKQCTCSDWRPKVPRHRA